MTLSQSTCLSQIRSFDQSVESMPTASTTVEEAFQILFVDLAKCFCEQLKCGRFDVNVIYFILSIFVDYFFEIQDSETRISTALKNTCSNESDSCSLLHFLNALPDCELPKSLLSTILEFSEHPLQLPTFENKLKKQMSKSFAIKKSKQTDSINKSNSLLKSLDHLFEVKKRIANEKKYVYISPSTIQQ